MGPCDHPTQREVPTAGIDPNAAYWPTPMTWGEVRGQVRGNFRIQCYYRDDRLPEIVGRFTLELRGGGVVLGSYTDDRYTREANGIIHNDGQAGGNGRASDSTIVWAAPFARSGNRLVIENPSLVMTPSEPGGCCDRGVMEQD